MSRESCKYFLFVVYSVMFPVIASLRLELVYREGGFFIEGFGIAFPVLPCAPQQYVANSESGKLGQSTGFFLSLVMDLDAFLIHFRSHEAKLPLK